MYGKSIAKRNIERSIASGRLKDIPSVKEAIDMCILELENSREQLYKQVDSVNGCEHSYGNPTYTIQRRILGFVTVYKRKCLTCGNIELFTKIDEGDEPPDWAEGAKRMYYNNDI